jgi:outer membrane protein OmpA-like peptidoglycan-associated protein
MKNSKKHENGEYWLSISDMMSGLMFIFLLISVIYMREVTKERAELKQKSQNIKTISQEFDNTKEKISLALISEFKNDLPKWNAEIEGTIFRFKSPDILFQKGRSKLNNQFKAILSDFFPRYIRVLSEFKIDIEEIRIEGHTSSKWNKHSTREESYLKNAQLSQQRALKVLEYSISQTEIKSYFEWLILVLRSNGLSFSKVIKNNGIEDFQASRRVEFRVATNSEKQLEKIKHLIKTVEKNGQKGEN